MKFLPPLWDKKIIREFHVEKLTGQPCMKLTAESWDNPMSVLESPYLALVRKRVGKRFVGHGKILNRHWIKEREIQRWKKTCDQSKGNDCRKRPAISALPNSNPKWLIDTERQCLVEAEPELSYFALSYVWGGVEFYKTLKENLEQRQFDNAFSNVSGVLELPLTIKDAMALVEILGERYLRVDSLCIVRDDEAEKHEQFNQMAAIFGKADTIIISEEGTNPFHDLRGLHRVSRPRYLPRCVYELQKGLKIIESRRPKRAGRSIWGQRGWTFQENLFSKRRIIFYEGTVRWECNCGVWYEGLNQSIIQDLQYSTIRMHQMLFQLPYPDLQRYNEIVSTFNVKRLTYPEDVLPAFAGIIYSLSSIFDGGFLCGLPVMCFDVALLWRPSSPLERRILMTSALNSYLPSWSWAGWRGKVDPKSWLVGCDYESGHFSFDNKNYRITPLAKWYSYDQEKQAKKLVESTMLNFREEFFGKDRLPPPGWTRHECHPHAPRDADSRSSIDGSRSDGCAIPLHWYKHESVSENAFWYPVPLCSERQDPLLCPAATFLSCETNRALLFLSEKIAHGYMSFTLRDQFGAWAGAIQLHEDPFKSGLLPYDPASTCQKKECELVAISLGQAQNSIEDLDLAEWKIKERPKQMYHMYEFYNVLWIEWKEVVAYRKGIGRVMKNIWDSQALECIDLTLG